MRTPTRDVPRNRIRPAVVIGAGFALMTVLVPLATADTFHLVSGAVIEGDLVDEVGGKVRILIGSDPVLLLKGDIRRRDPAPTIWQRHEAEKKNRPDTAKGLYDLAIWCEDNGLAEQAREHYRAALVKDPTLTAAYEALGLVRVGDVWLDAGPPATLPGAQPGRDRVRQPLLDEIQAGWMREVNVIRRRCFARNVAPGGPDRARLFKEGRDRILAISDPLAISSLCGGLSPGTAAMRRVLVEALARFPQDEATANLLALALFDPESAVRSAAAGALSDRADTRVETELRRALLTGDEPVIRAGAAALGAMKAQSAAQDLIEVLLTGDGAAARLSPGDLVAGLTRTFNRPTTVTLGGRRYQHTPVVAVCDAFVAVAGIRPATRPAASAPALREEVREALRALAGRDFGDDVGAWKRWAAERPSTQPSR